MVTIDRIKKDFTLNDIKDGYNMTLRNGDIYFKIMGNIIDKDGRELEYFDQNLKNHFDEDYDIMKLYDDNFKLVYERPEEVKYYKVKEETLKDLIETNNHIGVGKSYVHIEMFEELIE